MPILLQSIYKQATFSSDNVNFIAVFFFFFVFLVAVLELPIVLGNNFNATKPWSDRVNCVLHNKNCLFRFFGPLDEVIPKIFLGVDTAMKAI